MALVTSNEVVQCKQNLLHYIEYISKSKPYNNVNDYSNINCYFNKGTIITEEERIILLDWAIGILDCSKKYTFKRINYYLEKDDNRIIPLVFEIKDRIIKKENLYGHKENLILKDFLAYVLPNGKVHKHTDNNGSDPNFLHTRFNVFLLNPNDDFFTYYNNIRVNTLQTTYAICRSGIDYHWTDTNLDSLPRISLSFGFSLPRWKIDEILPIP